MYKCIKHMYLCISNKLQKYYIQNLNLDTVTIRNLDFQKIKEARLNQMKEKWLLIIVNVMCMKISNADPKSDQ